MSDIFTHPGMTAEETLSAYERAVDIYLNEWDERYNLRLAKHCLYTVIDVRMKLIKRNHCV